MKSNSKKILCLFPPSTVRMNAVKDVLGGGNRPERYLFYGLDYFKRQGLHCIHNVVANKESKVKNLVALLHKFIFKRLFIYYCEIEWVFPVFRHLYTASLLFVFSERIMLALAYWRIFKLMPRTQTVFMPMGLPEKLEVIRKNRPYFYRLLISELYKIDCIVCVSKKEQEILQKVYGFRNNTHFVKAGVDSTYFIDMDVKEDVDVLSVGGDKFRDFALLFNVASRLKYLKFRVITTRSLANIFSEIPPNVEVVIDVPMMDIRKHIAKGKILALPVTPNSYSGATTVLLQAMSMGKAVIANKEGANTSGYSFDSGKNLLFIDCLDADQLSDAICRLLGDDTFRYNIGKNARKTIEEQLDLLDFHKRLFEFVSSGLH